MWQRSAPPSLFTLPLFIGAGGNVVMEPPPSSTRPFAIQPCLYACIFEHYAASNSTSTCFIERDSPTARPCQADTKSRLLARAAARDEPRCATSPEARPFNSYESTILAPPSPRPISLSILAAMLSCQGGPTDGCDGMLTFFDSTSVQWRAALRQMREAR